MRTGILSKILPIAAAALLWACAGGANSPNGAVGGGGPVGGSGAEDLFKGGGAAQPMDTGAAVGKKDYENIKYFLREASATVLCKEGSEHVRVTFKGFLMSEGVSGDTHAMTGLFKISDLSGLHFLVTQTSMEQGQLGYFKATLKVKKDLNMFFSYILSHDGPMDTLLPVDPEAFYVVYPAEPRPSLQIAQGPMADNACMSAVPDLQAAEAE